MLKRRFEAGVGMLRSAAALKQERNRTMKQVKPESPQPPQGSSAPSLPSAFCKTDKEKANSLRLFWV
jgi:hypothetical protein